MRTALGLIFFLGALVLLVAELIVLGDPGAFTVPASRAAPAPWYVHAAWFLAIGAMGWMAARLLRHGILGRLVRGRGFTPAAR